MLSISPAKILVVLLVALIVLGPDKLPGMARQAGNFLHELRRLRDRVESEMRSVMPEGMPLPSEIVRSPLAFLASAADVPVDGGPVDGVPVDGGPVDGGPVDGGPVDDGNSTASDAKTAGPGTPGTAGDPAAGGPADTAQSGSPKVAALPATPSYATRPWPGGPAYGGSPPGAGGVRAAPGPAQPNLVIVPGDPELN